MNDDLIRRGACPLLAILLALVLVTLTLPGTGAAQEAVDDQTCLGCHDGLDKSLAGSPHRISSQVGNPAVTISCSSCHGDAGAHAADPSPANITHPGKADAQKVLEICQTCHVAHHELDNVGFDPHLGKDVSCVSCHSVHGGSEGLLRDGSLKFCGDCHVALNAQFTRRSVHPVADGNVTCLSCHDFLGAQESDIGHGPNANCYQCHPEQSGPYLWEHEATSSFAPEGAGCTACHSPHGSANDRLLTQTGDRLCRQCHGIPPLHLTYHGGLGGQYACMDCHTDIHGSYDNKNLLDADLGGKIQGGPTSCFCHGVDGGTPE